MERERRISRMRALRRRKREREAAGIEIGHREGSSAMETFSLVVERFLRRTNTVEWRGGREGGE